MKRLRSINPSDPRALEKVIEAIEVAEGIRGNEEDRKPTYAEVKRMIGGGAASASSSTTSSQSLGGSSTAQKPANVNHALFNKAVVLTWDIPSYSGHAKTEVWRSTDNNIQNATYYAEVGSSYFIDTETVADTDYYYFLRHKTSERLGSTTSGFTAAYHVNIPADPSPPVQPVPTIEVISSEANHTVSVQNAGKPVAIRLSGSFYSSIEWDDANTTLLPEDGNAITVTLKKGVTALLSITPTKIQTSLLGANGEKQFIHLIDTGLVNNSSSDNTDYTIEITRQFPTNTDGFQLTVELIP